MNMNRRRLLDAQGSGIALLFCLTVACGSSIRHDGRRGPVGSLGGSGGTAGSLGEAGTEPGAQTGGHSASGGSAAAGRSGSDAGGVAGAPDDPEPGSVALDGTPFYTRVPRLTVSQWEHAVTDILRFTESHDLSREFLRPVKGLTDFDNNEKVLFVDAPNFLDFETGAEAAAALATGSDAALAALYEGDDAAGFVRTVGRRAFRRPLTDAEEAAYGAIFARGEELYGAGFAHGAALVIRALLQSPHFLYRPELGAEGKALNGYELAAKLSFWLLDTTPSDALLDAAAAGVLDSDDGLEAVTRDMLAAPEAVAVMRDFHRQLLVFDDYASLDKSDVPDFGSLRPELEAASTAFVDQIFQTDLGLRELLTSNQAYVGPGLAPFYGLTASASGLELRDLGAARSGYFMQVPFLMRWADGARSNPIERGFRLARMLCGQLPAPIVSSPPIPPPQAGQTTRDQVTALTAGCGGACHALIDPLGFSLESFDGLGQERTADNGIPVDTASSYAFAEGVQQFADGNELMRIMADSAAAHTCYSKNVTGYALGRDMAESDRPLLEGLGQVSLSHSLRELAVALVRDPAFRSRPEVTP